VSLASGFRGGHFAGKLKSPLYKLKDAIIRFINCFAYPADVILLVHQLSLAGSSDFSNYERGAKIGNQMTRALLAVRYKDVRV